ncbi:unnamed protein product [Moneuplotes crassus]|uniref:Cleavage and polyadenylation specificity factor subunit 3 n=1 Tax=Euplotes crassus TaxID=5936 RepID=A0AAD1YBB4_EUPCR|nr:unnamed protein product [Moneuplotes crassus]
METEILRIIPLGAGKEVGRSCVLLVYRGKRILFDCGLHPAHHGIYGLPYFDFIEPEDIDILLVTHFHIDHCGALPYFLARTNFKGKVIMTHPTKAIYNYVLQDFIRICNVGEIDILFDESDLSDSMDKIIPIRFHEELEFDDVKIQAYIAGHVLGAAMFLVDIGGVKILYTGDYSTEEDRHLKPAEIPKCNVDILIVESTYGIRLHEPRDLREEKFKSRVHDIIKKGGRCLLPCFALGKAQELLLILNEYWKEHEELKDVPIYYTGLLATKSLNVFQTYRNMMREDTKEKIEQGENPFHFEDSQDYMEKKPLVIIATPGMLQSGLSRYLFEEWCEDENSGVIFTGYSVEGTLAQQIMNQPNEIQISHKHKTLKLKMDVAVIDFSAHCDFKQTSHFIRKIKPANIVLVHGGQNEMAKLKKALELEHKNQINVHCPQNCQSLIFTFFTEKSAKVVGKAKRNLDNFLTHSDYLALGKGMPNNIPHNLSEDCGLIKFSQEDSPSSERLKIDNTISELDYQDRHPEETKLEIEQEEAIIKEYDDNMVSIEGLFVESQFDNMIINETEIQDFASLSRHKVSQQLVMPFEYDPGFFIKAAEDLFDKVQVVSGNTEDLVNDINLKIEDIDLVYRKRSASFELKWDSSAKSDLLADAIALLIIQLANNPPASMVYNMTNHCKEKQLEKLQFEAFKKVLREHCEEISIVEDNMIEIFDSSQELVAKVDYNAKEVISCDESIKEHLKALLDIHNHSCSPKNDC